MYLNRRKKRSFRKRIPYGKIPLQFRRIARKNFVKNVKDIVKTTVETKVKSTYYNNVGYNASELIAAALTDIPQSLSSNGRIGIEVTGEYIDILANVLNTTANDLFVRFALVELAGRGGTEDISTTTGMFLDPDGLLTSHSLATAATTTFPGVPSAAIMYKYDPASVTLLKEKVVKVSKANSGNDSSSRTIRWKVPYPKKITYSANAVQGALIESRRVSLVVTAWSPTSTTQSTYTYVLNAQMQFYFKDS